MDLSTSKQAITKQLQKEVLEMQGYKRAVGEHLLETGLGEIEESFPDGRFPTAAVHEFISYATEEAAATVGFMSGILGRLMQKGGACLWVTPKNTVFPPALVQYGIEPHRIIFAEISKPKDLLWTVEEGLKCEALCAVVGDLSELGFTESRRLQLAVEQSKIPGFIHRQKPRSENTVACYTRWKIKPLPSNAIQDLPGIGYPRWEVQLMKVRNGKPGKWIVEWKDGDLSFVQTPTIALPLVSKLMAG